MIIIEIKLFLGNNRNENIWKLELEQYCIDCDRETRYNKWITWLNSLEDSNIGITTDNKEFIKVLAYWLKNNIKVIFSAELEDSNGDIRKWNKKEFIKCVLEYNMEMRGE